jgi:hypothetical protein
MKTTKVGTAALVIGALAVLGGCSDSATGPGGGGGQVSLSLAAPAGTGSGGSASRTGPRASFSVTRTDGEGNELVLDSLQLVLREVELERAGEDDCPDDSTSGTDDDACEEFETDIRLFRVPLDGSVERTVTVSAEPDSYDELEFDIHKPDDQEPDDQQFIDDNPTFADISIRAKGAFTPSGGQATDFVFTQDLNVEQEIPLSPALVVEDGASVNLTLRVDWRSWFTSDGSVDGVLLDPATANDGGANEGVVEENIKNSFEAFEDEDGDGEDDGGDTG